MSKPIVTSLNDITKIFAHFSIRQYHIGWDRKDNMVIHVPKEYLGKVNRIVIAYVPITLQDCLRVKKINAWTRFKIYFKMAFFPLALAVISGCASTPKQVKPCDPPGALQGVLHPGERGHFPPGSYIVVSRGKPPLKWCSETEIEWVPTFFKRDDGTTIDMEELH